jgi:hypothetical protein
MTSSASITQRDKHAVRRWATESSCTTCGQAAVGLAQRNHARSCLDPRYFTIVAGRP